MSARKRELQRPLINEFTASLIARWTALTFPEHVRRARKGTVLPDMLPLITAELTARGINPHTQTLRTWR